MAWRANSKKQQIFSPPNFVGLDPLWHLVAHRKRAVVIELTDVQVPVPARQTDGAATQALHGAGGAHGAASVPSPAARSWSGG